MGIAEQSGGKAGLRTATACLTRDRTIESL